MNISNVNRQSLPAPARDASSSKDGQGTVPAPDAVPLAGSGNQPAPAHNASTETSRLEKDAEQARKSVQELVARVSKQSPASSRALLFSVDDALGKTIVKVIDRDTDQVIRQIPSEEFVRFAQALDAIGQPGSPATVGGDAAGLLIQEQA